MVLFKGIVHLLTLKLFQTCIKFFLLLNTKLVFCWTHSWCVHLELLQWWFGCMNRFCCSCKRFDSTYLFNYSFSDTLSWVSSTFT